MTNTALVFDLLLRSTEYAMKLQQALQRAQAEGRDITDEELATLKRANDAEIDDLLSR